MISYEGIEVEHSYTEGFETTLPSAMSVLIGAGSMIVGSKTMEFPEIEFDLESDEEVPVVYDVYLLEEDDEDGFNVCVQRTELGVDVVPIYEGQAALIHCLTSILLPPLAASLDDIDIKIRTMKNTAEEDTDEIPTEE